MSVRRRPLVLAASLSLALALPGVSTARGESLSELAKTAQSAHGGLFQSVEFSSSSFQVLPQWRRVLGKMQDDGADFALCVGDAANCTTAAQRSWRELIGKASRLTGREKLDMVNRFFNRWPYKLDQELYGLSEYWASPREFLTRSGDCEDYAIAKFFALRQLGYANDDLRIVILWDQIRAIGHAVLAVYQPDGVLVLDSLSDLIAPDLRYKHYIPQYSMNETTRWAHVHAEAIPQTAIADN